MEEQVEFKRLHLRKQKSINDFSKCEKISGEIIKLLNEKKDYGKTAQAIGEKGGQIYLVQRISQTLHSQD